MSGTIFKIVDGEDKVKKNDNKYGFIRDEGGNDRFFHYRDVKGGLAFSKDLEGTRVEFDAFTTERGLRATNVRATA